MPQLIQQQQIIVEPLRLTFLNHTKLVRCKRCSKCFKVIRQHNKSGLCTHHLLQIQNKRYCMEHKEELNAYNRKYWKEHKSKGGVK